MAVGEYVDGGGFRGPVMLLVKRAGERYVEGRMK
jgi:hypothetical protein